MDLSYCKTILNLSLITIKFSIDLNSLAYFLTIMDAVYIICVQIL